MKHLWTVTKTIRNGFDVRHETESGETDSLPLAKAMAEQAHERLGGNKHVRATISRPEGFRSWTYEPGRRMQMVWRED